MKRRRPMCVESERREPAMKRVAAPQPVPSTEYKLIHAMNTILESIISSNLRELPCVFCSEMSGQLYSPTELKNHLNESHSALELHACHFCARAFSSTLGLLNHPCPDFAEYLTTFQYDSIDKIISKHELHIMICQECGLQLNISFLYREDEDELSSYIDQFHDCLLMHYSRQFVICTLNFLETCNANKIKLQFLTPNETIGAEMRESFLPIYIKEASKLQSYRKQSANLETAPKTRAAKKFFVQEKYFTNTLASNGDVHYTCKLCGHRSRPNIQPGSLLHHVRDKHPESVNHLRFFNAQSEFNRIELGDGNFRFECKVCGHKTKMNVKPNALSQHFSDRHPELRAQASLLLSNQVDSFDAHNESTKSIESELNGNQTVNLSVNGNVSVILDKDAHELEKDIHSKWFKCEASINIEYTSGKILYLPLNVNLLGNDVFQCKKCYTICVGSHSAKCHFNKSHSSNGPFDIQNADQVKQLFCRNDLPYSGVICKNCDSTHCSVLSLRTHIYISHGFNLSILDLSRGKSSVSAFDIRQSILKKSQRCSPSSSAVADCITQIFGKQYPSKENNSSFRSNGDSVVAVKSEVLISQIDDQIEDMDSFDCSMQASLSSSKFSVGNCDRQDDNPFELSTISRTNMASSSQPHKTPLSSQLESSSSADETRAKRLEAMRNRKLKPCKFNAQQYFSIIIDEDGRSRRYQCTICGHITKPNVCSTALSQHFSDRHPHMRAIANHNAGILVTRPKKRRFSLQNRLATHLNRSAAEPEHVIENPDTVQKASEHALNNSTPQITEPSPVDDIVFGKFLDTCTMDEFERLLRNQQTVLPYFEIAVKANPEISVKLFQTLSILTSRNAESADNKEKIVSFIGELLKRSRTLGVSVLEKVSAAISKKSMKETSAVKCNSATDIKEIFIVLDELLSKCGY
ncbi:zinc finger, C2H2 type [Ditylenchus destructor]|nr:zinc finger, C2H2 type [Ditylenchus destructor]